MQSSMTIKEHQRVLNHLKQQLEDLNRNKNAIIFDKDKEIQYIKKQLMEVESKVSLNARMKLELEKVRDELEKTMNQNQHLRTQIRQLQKELENTQVEIHILGKDEQQVPKIRYFDHKDNDGGRRRPEPTNVRPFS
jgi:hypothetical protein